MDEKNRNAMVTHRTLYAWLALVILAFTTAQHCCAARLFAMENTMEDCRLVEINPGNGGVFRTWASPVGYVDIDNLAYDPSTDRLFGIGLTGALHRISMVTGEFMPIGRVTTSNGWAVAATGLAVHPETAELYTITHGGQLYKVNKQDGAATYIGDSFVGAVHALAFDTNGTLYASDTAGSGTSKLLTVSTETGAYTQVATIERDYIVGLAFDPSNTLYGADNGTDSLVTIDVATGSAKTVGGFGNERGHSIAFVQPTVTTNELDIASVGRNGSLTWYSAQTQGYFTVQWASSPTGVWHSTWETLWNRPALDTEVTVEVPMYYRVRWTATPGDP